VRFRVFAMSDGGLFVVAVVFWGIAASVFFVYAGYPILLALAGLVLDRRVARADHVPTLTLIIAAYNEQRCIAERLENALASDYPAEALEIIVASDGSTDATNAIVESYARRGVRLLALPRRGKVFALNDAVRHARGDVLVFSDANTDVEPQAIRALARNFADPRVGGVVGNTGYRLETGSESASQGESLYWRYDTFLKEMESRTGSVVSAHGGLYAIRRHLYEPPADAAVTDDFMISTGVVAQGFRLVFEPGARGWEAPVPKSSREFQRRVRLMTRGIRGVAQRARLLDPRRYGFYSGVLLTHKVLRRLVPVGLVLLFICTAILSGSPFYRSLLLAQGGFYSLALVGFLTRSTPVGRLRLLYVPFFFCLANAAALVAIVNFLRGQRISRWEPQRHVAGAAGPAVPARDIEAGAGAGAGHP